MNQNPVERRRGMFAYKAGILVVLLFAEVAFGVQNPTRDDADKGSIKRAAENGAASGKEEPATNLEKMLIRRDVLLIKEFFNIGIVLGQQGAEVRIEALALSALGEPTKRYGVSFVRPAARNATSDRSSSRDVLCLVDFDELAAIQNALDYISKTVSNSQSAAETESSSRTATKPAEATTNDDAAGPFMEFSILTRSGMKIGMLQLGKQNTGFVQMNYQASDSSIIFGIGALNRLRNLITQARTKLLALGAK
jgi:hypothetical protein